MNIRLAIIIPLAIVSVLAGCSTAVQKNQEASKHCIFPGTREAAPGWVCVDSIPGWKVTAQGVAEKTAAGPRVQMKIAKMAANMALTQGFQVHVANQIMQFAEASGTTDKEIVDKVQNVTAKQIAGKALVGSRVIKSISDSKGRLWVLVGIDVKRAKSLTKNVIRSSYNNNRALWHKFQRNRSREELASAIAAQKVSDNASVGR